jgi:hypothetical protein
MKHFRMISRCGEGLALLLRIAEEGHEVDFWLPGTIPNLYESMLPRVADWHEGLDDETFVIFDSPGSGNAAVGIKNSWGAGTFNDVLQFDREFGLKIARLHQFKMPAEDEKVDGPEVYLQAWYVMGKLVTNSLFSTIESNGSVVGWFWPPKRKRDIETTATIYRHTLHKMGSFLETNKFCGPLCVRTIIGKEDGLPYFYGFETGLRYPSIYAMAEVLDGWGDMIAAMSVGEMPMLQPSHDWIGYFGAGAVHVTGRSANIADLKAEIKKAAGQIRIGYNPMLVEDLDCENTVELLKRLKYF